MVRYFLRRSPDPRPTLVVETCDVADERRLRDFRELLHGLGCSNGLLFDPKSCLIVHDTFTSLGPESLAVKAEIPTDTVLGKVERSGQLRGRPLDRRVGVWLDVLTSRWEDALPDAPAVAAPFITDVVLAAAQAVISDEDLAA